MTDLEKAALKNKTVKASTKNAALQLRNESVIEEDFPKVNITYPIMVNFKFV